jgi:hypothetical protein
MLWDVCLNEVGVEKGRLGCFLQQLYVSKLSEQVAEKLSYSLMTCPIECLREDSRRWTLQAS